MSSKWIERGFPPKKEDRYLVINTNGFIYIADYWYGEWFVEEEMQVGITHWRHLVKPPRKIK